jgi:hypothetical protein
MTDSIASAYLAALAMMDQTGPRDLHRTAALVDPDATNETLRAHLSVVGQDDALRNRLRLSLATWDHLSSVSWTESTYPNTVERRAVIIRRLNVDDATAAVLIDQFPIYNKDGDVVIAEKWERWYTDDIRKERDFYWKSYRELLARKNWDATAIASLDNATNEVIGLLSDPARDEAYQAKGLVVGYVQSGKTANFTGVVAKAVDAGYRLIIVLTGTTDLLRAQTQRRLDMELIGVENILGGVAPDDEELLFKVDYQDDPDWLGGRFLRHNVEPADVGFPAIDRLTTYKGDYKSLQQGIAALDFPKHDRTLPFYRPENLLHSDARVAVVKKNATVLRKLVTDLRRIKTRLGEIPTLIVDDESDQASVNTSNPKKWQDDQKERTTINSQISELLRMLPRAQYVGYTATPFANVFVDPGDSEDIFPKDFLLSLRRPRGYMGASDFHDLDNDPEDSDRTFVTSAEKAHVRFVDDERGEDDRRLPEAMDAFVLAGAMKLYRTARGVAPYRHHTMLVHEATRRAIHREQAERIAELWKKAGYYSSTSHDRLRSLFDNDIRPVAEAIGGDLPTPESFDQLLPFVFDAAAHIGQSGNPVLVINSDKDTEQEELDFDRRPVWRILVGGNKLARGFTVEGLTVSYYGRMSKQADTMMQMGRWFGFRENYRDLVRLYIWQTLYEAFEAIVLDEEYFRNELRRYAQWVDGEPQVTPRQVPPLVAQHLPWLKPTATSKMYNAVLSERRSPGTPVEPRMYSNTPEVIESNTRAFLPLLEAARREVTLLGDGSTSYKSRVGIVPHITLVDVLSSLEWADEEVFRADLNWLRRAPADRIEDWAVLLPQHNQPRGLVLGNGPLSLFRRKRLNPTYLSVISESRHRPAAARIAGARESIGDPEADRLAKPGRGAFLLYLVIPSDLNVPGEPDEISARKVVMAFHLVAPREALTKDRRLVTFAAIDSAHKTR